MSDVARILVVEDDAALARFLLELLGAGAGAAFAPEAAATLAAALGRLGRGGIDLILLDLGLPDSQGLDTLTAVEAAAPNVPVVVLTALDDEAVATSALRHGAQDYIIKTQLDVLPRAIRYALERRRAQAALESREAYFRTLIEHSLDLIVVLTDDLRISFIGPSVREILGFEAEAMCGRPATEFVHPDDREALERVRTEVTQAPGTLGRVECRVREKTGGWRVLDLKGKRVSHATMGQAWVLNARDVTDLRRVERERHALEEQFRQAQKMEAIGRLAGGVAHDFNNLLTVITGYSERLQSAFAETDPLRRAADAIRRSADRAAGLTQQLLAFSRRQILAPRVFDPNTVVGGVQKLMARVIGEDVRLTVELAPGTGQVKADPHQIEQVLLNLAVNSRDAMPDGGTLTIRTRNVRAGADERLAAWRPPDAPLVEIAVIDSGCGMDDDTLGHVFEPFFSTKGHGKGTGLGLSTVYGIVEQSGGHILVDSAPDHGTTFRVYLPRVDAPMAGAVAASAGSAVKGGAETILLVEDEEPVRLLVRDVLSRFGYTVLDARDGPDAERVSANHPGRVDLLLTDMVMPHMNGIQVAASITASRPGTRVLYMSGFTDHPLVQQGVADQAVAFIAKPFTPESLARKVREVLGE